MREIRFKGKRIDNGEWVYGWYHRLDCAGLHDKTFIIPSFASVLYSYAVDPETVGQHTGISDKNGVEIYEGDIVRNLSNENAVVVYENGCFYTPIASSKYRLGGWTELYVIGNIYDNPLEATP